MNMVRRAIITEKVKLLLTLYRPLLPPIFLLGNITLLKPNHPKYAKNTK